MGSLKLTSLVVLVVISARILAQPSTVVERSANMLPPAPTAAELGKYGLLPVGLSNGTARAVPLQTYRTKNLSLPVSLSYSSNGIKVDQVASWVGLGWSLNAGGVVTRIIRGEPDKPNPDPYPSAFGLLNVEGIKYLEKADPVNRFDSQQDLYAFNFMGYSGKFMYSREGDLVIMPHQNISIAHVIGESPSSGYYKITTSDGVIFTFDAIESTKTINEGTGCGRTFDLRRETSWFLSKIEHPSGDVITLEYEEYIYQYPLSLTQTVGRNISMDQLGCPSPGNPCFNDFTQTCQTTASIVGKRLKKISAVGYGSLNFISSNDRLDVIGEFKLDSIIIKNETGDIVKRYHLNYIYSQSSGFSNQWTVASLERRMFLTSVEQRDSADDVINSHLLTYEDMNGLPPRLSYAQDHWGYFNGVNNQYLVPFDELNREDNNGRKVFAGIGGNRQANGDFGKRGLLKTITWPTGGQTTLHYEPQTYFGSKYNPPLDSQISLTIHGSGHHTLNSVTLDPLEITFTQEIKIVTRAVWDEDYPGEIDPLHHIVTVSVWDLTESRDVYSQHLALGQTVTTYLDVDANHSYKVDLTASGQIVEGGVSIDYLLSGPQLVETNIETGGLRIAKTTDSGAFIGKTLTTSYWYSRLDNPTKSSGVSRSLPIYYATDTQWAEVPCGSATDPSATVRTFCHNGIMHSSSISTLYPADGGNVFYKYVTVTTGEEEINGATEHEFIINFDQQGQQVWGNDEILSVPLSNFGWNNGLEAVTKTFRKSADGYVLLKSVVNEYKTDDRARKEVKNLVVRRRYEPMTSQNAVVTCDVASINAKWEVEACRTTHSHLWLIFRGSRCIASGADNFTQELYGVCHGKAIGEVVTVAYALDHLDAMQYSSVAYWFYMFKSTQTNYDENGLNPVTAVSEYYYDNPEHALLSRTRQTMSDGRVKEVSTKYIDDYDDVSNLSVLREKFIVGMPIQSTTTIDGRLVQGDIITYNDMGLPVQLYKFEGTPLQTPPLHNPSVILPSQDYTSQAVFSYDASGNLKDMASRKSPDISYVWSYGRTKVVAKAIGATSSRIYVQGFEETGTDTNAKTGEKSLATGSYTISTNDFAPTSTDDLVMSYWYWEGSEWKFSGELPFNRNISAGSKLDEIRVFPRGAQMTTIWYDSHFDNVKTTTDPNNVTQYYEYDPAGRLKAIRDDRRNMTTSYKYHYYNN